MKKNINKSRILSKTVEYRITDKEVTAYKFIKKTNLFFSFIKNVSDAALNHKNKINWIVSVKPGSIILQARPVSLNGSKKVESDIISILDNGLRMITDKKNKAYPEHFNIDSLKIISDLCSIGDSNIGINRKKFELNYKLIDNINNIMGTNYIDYGSIEGKLDAINIHTKPKISVYDALTGKAIRCYFDESMLDYIISAMGKRVSIYGQIRYKKNGSPISVDIEEIDIFPPQNELPKFKDIIGLYKN
ncbi:MAG: hypothetical protein JW860_01775 [Sedimentisphaerales bacterium]|nr:hypothetical protein [Sedimentisphaerales bacterium]